MADIALTKTAKDALCVALARTRGSEGYTKQDSERLSDWASGIVRQAEELREIVQGTRGLSMDTEGIKTFPLSLTKERTGRKKGLVQDCLPVPATPSNETVMVPRPKKNKGITGSQFTPLLLGGGKYSVQAKPGSLYDTVLGLCDKHCHLAESSALFERYRAGELAADELVAQIAISMEDMMEKVEASPKYQTYMQRIRTLSSGGSINATAKLARTLKHRLLEVSYLLAQSSSFSTAQPRNAWRLRKAGLTFFKASIKKPSNAFFCLFPSEYELDFHKALSEVGACVSPYKSRLAKEAIAKP